MLSRCSDSSHVTAGKPCHLSTSPLILSPPLSGLQVATRLYEAIIGYRYKVNLCSPRRRRLLSLCQRDKEKLTCQHVGDSAVPPAAGSPRRIPPGLSSSQPGLHTLCMWPPSHSKTHEPDCCLLRCIIRICKGVNMHTSETWPIC